MSNNHNNKKETPTAVRVARWTAVAAAITALGSLGDTLWTERPWWRETAAPVTISAPAVIAPEKPVPVIRGLADNRRSVAVPNKSVPVAVVHQPESRSLYQIFLIHVEHHPITTWLIIGSLGVGLIYLIVEYLHHRRNKLGPQP